MNRSRVIPRLLAACILAATTAALSVTTAAAEPLAVLPDDLPSLGQADAPISVIAVRSFRCGHCHDFQSEAFPLMQEAYIDTGRVHWRSLDADDRNPRLTIFEVARAAHAAGVYWEINDFLFSYAARSPSAIFGAVEQGDLPGRGPMLAALHDGSARRAAQADLKAARKLGITALPTFLIRHTTADGTRQEVRLTDPRQLRPTLDRLLAAESAAASPTH
ncbi:thioredoxin domain-containing protein [Actomonas aquatica]|uniref:Thioredoxin domain-containing protein n=1 Tax=Actomonas aquatica TaxID=2866162 RepID=A0ABZ1C5H2_9BACT|nr:thioredoxin domain-containing protein [Opitutus sp. WL0086]WRQ86905.1 thioredoxin domain-containing protein [Opitutus sp. WL0086]